MTHTHSSHEHRTLIALIITAITMLGEIFVGYWSQSLALLSDGWHMASHVFALGLTLVVYVLVRKSNARNPQSPIVRQRALALSGFASALVLQIIALLMFFEALQRIAHPVNILFADALWVASIGLLVNIVCAVLLHNHHHDDHNIKAAYLHVLADSVTSLLAILALTLGFYYNILWLDWACAVISAVVISVWAIGLIKETIKELIYT